MSTAFVVGVDIGGTSIRALLADSRGQVLGTGQAGGGSPTAHDPATAAARLGDAVRDALAGFDAARVAGAVLGMAGGGRLAVPEVRARFDAAWHGAGLRCGYRVIGDAVVGYAAGADAAEGTVLIAGTGAIAARVRDFCLVHVADGHGWLLGDAGSGFWLGREAVRRALSELDSLRPPGPLSRAVIAEVLGPAALDAVPAPERADAGSPDGPPRDTAPGSGTPGDPPRDAAPGTPGDGSAAGSYRKVCADLVNRIVSGPPVALAALAPVVLRGAASGDPVATGLVRQAADLLVQTVSVVRGPGDLTPIVLAGGLLTSAGPLAAELAARLSARWPGAPRSAAARTAAAAAWLALRDLGVDRDRLAALHASLVATPVPVSAPAG